MKRKILDNKFFLKSAQNVACDLLGKYIVRKWKGKEISLSICEVEAYDGFKDRASHASRGKTPRNSIMFDDAGFWYIYFTYGMHWMMNIVTGAKDYPSAVLIRGAGDILGPARLTKFLHVSGAQNKKFACQKNGLWIEDRGIKIKKSHIQRLPRIGVAYAGPVWSKKKYRFLYNEDKLSNCLPIRSSVLGAKEG
jgi:DNA-3-methyladenine glycosylase